MSQVSPSNTPIAYRSAITIHGANCLTHSQAHTNYTCKFGDAHESQARLVGVFLESHQKIYIDKDGVVGSSPLFTTYTVKFQHADSQLSNVEGVCDIQTATARLGGRDSEHSISR